MHVEYTITPGDSWSASQIATIKRNAIKYIGGVESGLEYPGVGIGADILRWKLEAVQHAIEGVDNVTVRVGRDPGSLATANLTLLAREYARTDETKITVIVL